MPHSTRLWATLSVAVSLLGSHFVTAGDPTQNRPSAASAATIVPVPPTELGKILAEWERHSTEVYRVNCTFNRSRFEGGRAVEFRAKGSLSVDVDGFVEYEATPVPIAPNEANTRKLESGRQIRVRGDHPEHWFWTSHYVLRLIDQRHWVGVAASRVPANEVEIKPNAHHDPTRRWSQDFYLARPFFIGMTREDVENRFEVRLSELTAEHVTLTMKPRTRPQNEQFAQATIKLRRIDYLPTEIDVESLLLRRLDVRHTFDTFEIKRRDETPMAMPEPEFPGYKWVALPYAVDAEP